jgi:hypothetical protein
MQKKEIKKKNLVLTELIWVTEGFMMSVTSLMI